jgi:hypothetical protein
VKILLQNAAFDSFPIDYTKKFSVIAPQLERELIPRIQKILNQRGLHATLKTIRDVLADYHKNGRRKLKDDQLDETQKKKKKAMGHVTNRLSEVNLLKYIPDFFFFNILLNCRNENEDQKERIQW